MEKFVCIQDLKPGTIFNYKGIMYMKTNSIDKNYLLIELKTGEMCTTEYTKIDVLVKILRIIT